jgi:replicative DNA helicase
MNIEELQVAANVDVEKHVLGHLLRYNDHYEAAKSLRVEDFSLDSHQRIFRRITTLLDDDRAADIITLADALKERKELESVGNIAYLASLTETLVPKPNIADYIRILKDKAKLRALQRLGEHIRRQAGEGGDPVELWSYAQERIIEIGAEQHAAVPPFSVDAMLEAIRKTPEGLETGWPRLDADGIGFRPKELSVLAGRTGHCKSTALVNVLFHQLQDKDPKKGKLVFFSHEEPAELVTLKLISLRTRTFNVLEQGWWSFENIRKHYASPDYVSGLSVPALEAAVAWLREREHRFEIIWRPGWDSLAICQYVRAMGKDNVAAVFIDYLQRVAAPDRGRKADRRDIEVSGVSRDFKTLAVDAEIPVIVAAQINRDAVEIKAGDAAEALASGGEEEVISKLRKNRPELHQIREGGAEQEADMVLGIMNYAADIASEDTVHQAANVTSIHQTPKQRQPTRRGSNQTRPSNPAAVWNTEDTIRRLDIGVLKQRYGAPGKWYQLRHDGLYGHIWQMEADRE